MAVLCRSPRVRFQKPAGRPLASVNPLGNRTTTVYDAAVRTVASIDPLGRRSTTVYNAASQAVANIDPIGARSTTVYDNASRPMASVDPLNHRTTTTYFADGQVKASINALAQRTTSVYDPAGRQVAVIDARGNRSTTIYNIASQAIAGIDAFGNRTTTVYDADGRPVGSVNALGNRVTTVFDGASRRIALVDGRANRYTFLYDAAGQQIAGVDTLNRRTTFGYDQAGQKDRRTDARGFRTTYAYDSIGELTQVRYPDATRMTFAYDNAGNQTMKANATGRYTTAYDPLGRPSRVVSPGNKAITYAYDPRGLRNWMSDPDGGRFTYSYDAAYRIDHLVNPQGDRTSYSYDAANRRTLTKLANGTRASVTYDEVGNLTTLANMDSGGAYISRYDYKYDANRNRTGVLEVDGSRVTWPYDKANQLLGEYRTGTSPYRQTYTYDAASNRTLKNVDGARTTYAYDAANQLTFSRNPGGMRTTYVFDPNGNQSLVMEATGGRTTTSWDYENKTKVIALPTGIRNTMAYEPNGLRVELDESTGMKKFVYDGQNYLLETDGTGITQAVYTNEPLTYGNLVSQRRGSVTRWYHFDGLGSARQLSELAESITDTYLYDAWGNMMSTSGTTINPFGWVAIVGYFFDPETGRLQVRERIYAPVDSLWTSRDPLSVLPSFVYAGNDPVLFFDATGMLTITRAPKGPPPVLGQNLPCSRDPKVYWQFFVDLVYTTGGGLKQQIHKGAPCRGWLVQEVKVFCILDDCRDQNLESQVFTYYEAWLVERKKNTSFWARYQYTDKAQFDVTDNTKGHYLQTGVVKFFCDADIDRRDKQWLINRQPATYGTGRCSTSPGGLRSTGTQPAFWNNANVPLADGPAGRKFAAHWCCCPRAKDRGINADAEP